MKIKILAAFLIFASVSALADQTQQKQKRCMVRAVMFESAAIMRDNRQDPKTALSSLSHLGGADTVPIATRKKIINLVYFDPSFEVAGGLPLRQQMYELCFYGPTHFKPLK